MESSTSSDQEEDEIELPLISDLNLSNDHYYCMLSEKPKIQDSPRKQTTTDEAQEKTNDFNEAIFEPIYRFPPNGNKNLNHTLPAYDLWKPFYPTYLNSDGLKNFHRPKLRHFKHGPQSKFKYQPIKNLARTIWLSEAKLRIRVQQAIFNGRTRQQIVNRYLRIYSASQLTAKTGQSHLFEYSEEYPPLLSQVGMTSQVKIYSSRPNKGDQLYFNPDQPPSPVIENNLYRAPIYEHEFQKCDFLVIRTRNSFYVRPVDGFYTVGQTMPLVEIPNPTSQGIMRFRQLLSNLYIHKIFRGGSLKLDILHKLFPDYPIETLRKRLWSRGAHYITTDRLFKRGTSEYGLLHRQDLWNLLTPEKYCTYMSMLVARERLRDLGYTETMIDPPKTAPIETEVLAAPWNTSKACVGYIKKRHYLNFKEHLIDPTGSKHEGFSCIPWIKSVAEEDYYNDTVGSGDHLANLQNKTIILNKLRLEKENRRKICETEAKHIFDVQNDTLGSSEVLSSDEDESEPIGSQDLDDSFENQLGDLSKLVLEGQTIDELAHEKEEMIRQQMLKDLANDNKVETKKSDKANDQMAKRALMITRSYRDDYKKVYERTEVIRDPRVIDLYLKKRVEKNGLVNVVNTKPNVTPQRRPISCLGDNELCRVEGNILRISKSVLSNTKRRSSRRFCEINK